MAKKETEHAKKKMASVMRRFKEGTLESSTGHKVTDRKQAIKIGMEEAGIAHDSKKGCK